MKIVYVSTRIAESLHDVGVQSFQFPGQISFHGRIGTPI